MRIIICGRSFSSARPVLAAALPEAEIQTVDARGLSEAAADADVLIPMMTRLDAGLIAATGAGLEGVDVDAATAKGIYVANVPSDLTPNAESTAEHALLLMLGAARRLGTCARVFREGGWGIPLGDALFGRRVLIVGFGRIGKALARRLIAMGMRVDAVRRSPEPGEAERHGLDRLGTPADLVRLAADADFVVCAASLTPDGRAMLNARVFAAMKRTAILVNVSRGMLVDEADLIAALREGAIAGAALDVFAQEPVATDHPLLGMEQVLATPHVAGVTSQSYDGICRFVVDNVRRVARGEAPANCVNLERLPPTIGSTFS